MHQTDACWISTSTGVSDREGDSDDPSDDNDDEPQSELRHLLSEQQRESKQPIILILNPICIYNYTELERLPDKYRSKDTQSSSMNEKASFDLSHDTNPYFIIIHNYTGCSKTI